MIQQKFYLDPAAVRRYLFKTTFTHPATLYPLVVGINLIVASLVFGLGSWITALACFSCLLSLGNLFLRLVIGREKAERLLFAQYQQALERQNAEKLAQLQSALIDCESQEGEQQLALLNMKFENFRQMLGRKLTAGSLTYSRYLNRGLSVYNAVIENLNRSVDHLRSVSAINVDGLEKRLSQTDTPEAPEQQALKSRLDLFHSHQSKSRDLLAANEAALTLLDRSAAELATVTTSALEEVDLLQAMQEFDECIKRMERYSIR